MNDKISELHAFASRCLDKGQLTEAAAAYRTLCELDSENPEVWLMLGAISGELGNVEEAIHYLKKAVAIRQTYAEAHFTLGQVLRAIGRNDEALESFRAAAVHDSEYAEAHGAIGSLLTEAGQYQEALESIQRVVSLDSDDPDSWKMLGWLYARLGSGFSSEEAYSNAIRLQGNNSEAHLGLGYARQLLGDQDGALLAYRQALSLNPDYAEAYNLMATILQGHESIKSAVECYEKAIELSPNFTEAHANLGQALLKQGRFEDAVEHFQYALDANPELEAAWYGLGSSLQELGDFTGALECFEKKQQLGETDACKLRMATILPVILDSREQLAATRLRLDENLSKLLEQPLSIHCPETDVNHTNFFLAYHGENDLALQRKMADVYLHCTPSLGYVSPYASDSPSQDRSGRIRVGFVSAHFRDHTIGTVMKGLIANLPRDRFDVLVFTTRQPDDAIAAFIREHADHYVELPASLDAARSIIVQHYPDVLFYTDIGMEPFTYYLAFARLAPVQCTTWGHPVTTGIPNVDYYISCRHFEPDDAREHYSEQLVLLDNPPTYYYRPSDSAVVSRVELGLSDGQTFYLCPQTLFKFHPDFDEYLAGILRRDHRGIVVLVESKHKHWAKLLTARFKYVMPDVAERIRLIPYAGTEHFRGLLRSADVILDTLHYGGGSTSLQALAYGAPIVTQPGNYQRGRHTYGYYRMMEFMDCVASDRDQYIELAVRLGTDSAWREAVSKEILARCGVLFENWNVLEELGRFFEQVADGNTPKI